MGDRQTGRISPAWRQPERSAPPTRWPRIRPQTANPPAHRREATTNRELPDRPLSSTAAVVPPPACGRTSPGVRVRGQTQHKNDFPRHVTREARGRVINGAPRGRQMQW